MRTDKHEEHFWQEVKIFLNEYLTNWVYIENLFLSKFINDDAEFGFSNFHDLSLYCKLNSCRSLTIYMYTAIFLTNGLCIVYCSLLQCLTLVYPGWGQKSEFFCLLVTTRRLRSGTVVGYCSTTTVYSWYTAAKGHWSTPGLGTIKGTLSLSAWRAHPMPLRGIYCSTRQWGTTRSTSPTMYTSASGLQEYLV